MHLLHTIVYLCIYLSTHLCVYYLFCMFIYMSILKCQLPIVNKY